MRNRNTAQGITKRYKKNECNPNAMKEGNRKFGRGWNPLTGLFTGMFKARAKKFMERRKKKLAKAKAHSGV